MSRAEPAVRVALVYALSGQEPDVDHVPVHTLHALGRFERNVARSRSLQLTGRDLTPALDGSQFELRCPTHGPITGQLGYAHVYRAPSGSRQLGVQLSTVATGATALTLLLQCTCNDRDALVLGGEPLAAVASHVQRDAADRCEFQQDVHSVVSLDEWPEGWSDGDLIRIVYREPHRTPRDGVPVARPPELNRFQGQVGMHGRGVTLLVGHDRHIVAACTLIAHSLILLIQQLRTMSEYAADLLERAQAIVEGPAPRHRSARFARLAHEVQKLDVRVATGIEQVYATGTFPEIVLDSYRDSLASTLGLPSAIRATTMAISGVRTFITAEYERIAGEQRDETARRERARGLIAAAGSAVLVPAALFVATLAIGTSDIHHDVSVFSTYYLPLWVAFAALLVVGVSVVAYFAFRRH